MKSFGFADVYVLDNDEHRAMLALKVKPRRLGLRTEGSKVNARAARRLLSYGYVTYEKHLVRATEAGLEALSRCRGLV